MKNIIKILFLIAWFSMFFITFESYAIDVIVTENVPWAGCVPEWDLYKCDVKPWFASILEMLQSIMNWFTLIAMMWGVLFIVINGILYTMWWNKEEIKKRIIQTLLWIIVLLLAWVILHIVAPWVYY